MEVQGMGARLGLSFSLEFKDAQGNLLKTIDCKGSVPLSETGLTAEQAQAIIDQQGSSNGADDSK